MKYMWFEPMMSALVKLPGVFPNVTVTRWKNPFDSTTINPLTNDKIFYQSKFKTFANDKLKVIQMEKISSR